MPRQRTHFSLTSFLGSPLFLVAGTLCLTLLAIILGRQLLLSYQVHQEIQGLQAEVTSLEGKNRDLNQLITLLNSDQYKQQQAKDLLFLKSPGESVVAVQQMPNTNVATSSVNSVSERSLRLAEEKSIPVRWWNYFFTY